MNRSPASSDDVTIAFADDVDVVVYTATSDTRPDDAFADRHQWLSTSPESGFVKVLTAQRRDATGVDVLRGLSLRRIGSDANESTLTNKRDLIAALRDLFDLDVGATHADALDALWPKLLAAHRRWEAAGRP